MAYFNTNRALYTEENIETASFWNEGNSERSRMNTTRLIEKERERPFLQREGGSVLSFTRSFCMYCKFSKE